MVFIKLYTSHIAEHEMTVIGNDAIVGGILVPISAP